MKLDYNQFLQAALPAAKVELGVSSALLLALPAFLALAVGAKDALSEIFGLKHVDGTYDDALKRWFELGKKWLRKMKSRKIGPKKLFFGTDYEYNSILTHF